MKKRFPFLFYSALLILVIAPALNCRWPANDRIPGYLYYRLNTNPTTLDPALITDVMGGGIAAKIFNGLIRFN